MLLACLAFIVYDLITFKNQMTEDLNSVAEIIGTNSAAALDFDNQNDAEETLMGLKVKGHITSACIYKVDGEVLAQYHRDGKPIDSSHPKPKISGFEFTKDRLHVFHEIFLDENKIGTVYLQSDLDELNARPKRYAVIILAVLGASMLAAFLMTSRLQRIISEPIRSLANTAKKVSDNKDFSVRAEKFSNDELGFLTERFNEMLTQIQDRDNTLQKIQTQLKNQTKKLQVELKGRKEFEKALSKSEERFKDLFDNAPDMYIIMDPDGIIIDEKEKKDDIKWHVEEYFPRLVRGCLMHGLIKEDSAYTGVVETVMRWGYKPKLPFLHDIAEKQFEKILGEWQKEGYSKSSRLFEQFAHRTLPKQGRKLIDQVLQDMESYLDLLLVWPDFVEMIEAIPRNERDNEWLFKDL